MVEKNVTAELCDAKHGELMNSMKYIEAKLDSVLLMLNGNGRPGIRETQNDVRQLREEINLLVTVVKGMQEVVQVVSADVVVVSAWRKAYLAARDNLFWSLLRPALPIIYGIITFIVWFALSQQFGV